MNSVPYGLHNIKPPLSGKVLARNLRKASPAMRAILVTPLTNGTAIGGLTKAQAARLGRVSAESIAIVAGASADQLEALWSGQLSLHAVRKANAKPRELTDSEVDAALNRIGLERVWSAYDRLTAPSSIAAE